MACEQVATLRATLQRTVIKKKKKLSGKRSESSAFAGTLGGRGGMLERNESHPPRFCHLLLSQFPQLCLRIPLDRREGPVCTRDPETLGGDLVVTHLYFSISLPSSLCILSQSCV